MGHRPTNPFPAPMQVRSVQCYHCLERFDVPARAMSLSCPWCYKRVTLDDLVIRDACWTSRLQTCGRLIVHRRGSVVAPLIEAREGIEIHGHAEGRVLSGGPVLIGPKARVKGDLSAPSIWVEPGAVIEGGYFRIVGADRLARGPSLPPIPPGGEAELAPGTQVVTRRASILPRWLPVPRPG